MFRKKDMMIPRWFIDWWISYGPEVMILPPDLLKENHPSKNVTILKDINDKRICRIERNFSSLEKGISVDNQLIDIKRFKQDKETEICFYSPIALLHRHQHIVQTVCEKDFNKKDTKERIMLERISFNQYAWTDSLIDIPIKVVINNILILFIIISNTQVTLIDSPLLITEENRLCNSSDSP